MAWQPQFYGEGHSFEKVLIPEGIEQGCRWEAFSPTPYKDKHRSGFKWAIGFGHVFGGETEPIKYIPDMVITREEGMEIFLRDMETKMRWLRKKITAPHCTTYMFNALGLLVLNTGEGNFERGPVLPLLNAEFYVGASAAFMHHSKSWQKVLGPDGLAVIEDGMIKTELKTDNGLVVRRACEIALFSTRKD